MLPDAGQSTGESRCWRRERASHHCCVVETLDSLAYRHAAQQAINKLVAGDALGLSGKAHDQPVTEDIVNYRLHIVRADKVAAWAACACWANRIAG